jgi:hypothetical protein
MEMFLGVDSFNLFVTETNYIIINKMMRIKMRRSRIKLGLTLILKKWKNFLRLLVIVGIVKRSEGDDYWSTRPLLYLPIFRNIMTRNRFLQLWNNNEHSHERLDKIKPVYLNLVKKFRKLNKLEKELFLDENIIPWSRRLFFRTYNLLKSTKYGILVRMVCEVTTGYIRVGRYSASRFNNGMIYFNIRDKFIC